MTWLYTKKVTETHIFTKNKVIKRLFNSNEELTIDIHNLSKIEHKEPVLCNLFVL